MLGFRRAPGATCRVAQGREANGLLPGQHPWEKQAERPLVFITIARFRTDCKPFPFVFLLFSYLSEWFRTISCNLICPRERAPSIAPPAPPAEREAKQEKGSRVRPRKLRNNVCFAMVGLGQLCKTLHFANVSAGESGIPGETARVPAGGHPADTGGAAGEGARPPAPRPPEGDALPGGEAERAMNGLCNGEPAAGAGGATPRASGPPATHHKI